MPTLQIDFTLTRDKRGYRIVPKEPLPPRRSGQSNLDRILAAKASNVADRIIGNGGPLVPWREVGLAQAEGGALTLRHAEGVERFDRLPNAHVAAALIEHARV